MSYCDDEEIVAYLPESSLRSEEIATSFENRADRLYALYRIITDKRIKVVITSPYGYIRHLPEKDVLQASLIHIRKDDNCSRDELIASLKKLATSRYVFLSDNFSHWLS